MYDARSSGVLLAVSSLPGPYGIGSLGAPARRFVDFLAEAGQTYWQYMRGIFKQIIHHNICKANRIQNNQYAVDDAQYRECFEQLDPVRILEIQNTCSREEMEGFIWVLCTCIFFVAEYNFTLVI